MALTDEVLAALIRASAELVEASDTKDGVLEEVARALAEAEPSLSAERLQEVLADREELQSTGIGEGVAIPHGKISGLERIVASFARSVKGVDFESIDGQPTHLFFLLVVPEHSGGQHLKALARISRFFRDAEFRQKLISAACLDDVFRCIEEEDAKF